MKQRDVDIVVAGVISFRSFLINLRIAHANKARIKPIGISEPIDQMEIAEIK